MKFKTNFIVSVMILWLLFLPKIDIFQIGSFYIRLEDLLYLLLLPVAIQNARCLLDKRLTFAHLYLAYILLSFCSSIITYLLGGFDNLFLSFLVGIRQLQYFLLFPIAVSLQFTERNFRKTAIYYVYFSAVVSLLQSANILAVSRFSSDRFMSVTNGPYEFAVQVVFCIAILGGNLKYIKSSIVAFISLIATSSRVTIIGFALFKAYSYISSLIKDVLSLNLKLTKSKSIALFVIVGLTALILAQYTTDSSIIYFSFFDRLKDISLSEFYSIVQAIVDGPTELADSAGFADQSQEYIFKYYSASNFDLSGMIRLYKYISLLRIQLSSLTSIFWGLGPGYIASALDSSILRILIENGIIGFTAFALFLCSIFYFFRHKTTYFSVYEILWNILFTSLLIDIFWSSKVMPFFWLIIGFETANVLRGLRRKTSVPSKSLPFSI